MDTDSASLGDKCPTGPPTEQWGKGSRYTAHLRAGGRMIIHCKPHVFTGVRNYVLIRLGLRDRLYKVWCTLEPKDDFKLCTVFQPPRYVKVRTTPFLHHSKAAKRAVAAYLDVVYDEIMFSSRIRAMWALTSR